MYSYFFILGRHAHLSVAEIFSALKDQEFDVKLVSPTALIISTDTELDTARMLSGLGGTIKAGVIISEAPTHDANVIFTTIREKLAECKGNGRLTFGISAYGTKIDISKIGIRVKYEMREEGVSVRYVAPQEGNALTSVVVDKNKLMETGGEFVVIEFGDKRFLGETKAVQAFEAFSNADYGRPGRDTVQGMLPPKLARIMVNLAGVNPDAVMLDPFCGSGTVLTEALQLGYRKLFGSDSNPEAIKQTEQNLDWFKEKGIIAADAPAVSLHVADARNVGQHLAAKSVDAVITETFLGPVRKGRETRGDLQRTLFQLSKLYYQSMSAWTRILKKDAVIVIALPHYVLGEERHGVSLKECFGLGYKIVPMLPVAVAQKMKAEFTKNGGLIYGREGQLVYREIVKLRWNIPQPGKQATEKKPDMRLE